MKSELLDRLTEEEQTELRTLNEEIAELKKELISTSTRRSDLENQKVVLENQLSTNLEKRKEELTEQQETLRLTEQNQQLEQYRRELNLVQSSIDDEVKRLEGE